jgi:hypothetical protein
MPPSYITLSLLSRDTPIPSPSSAMASAWHNPGVIAGIVVGSLFMLLMGYLVYLGLGGHKWIRR